MKLKSKIFVNKTEDEVWEFFNEVNNLAKWDHSVEKVLVTSSSTIDKNNPIGFSFDTIGPSVRGKPGLVTSYEVVASKVNKYNEAKVTKSNLFKSAKWRNETEKTGNGTNIIISVDFTLKNKYKLLYPVIYLRKGAMDRDMKFLKAEIEKKPSKDG